MPLEIVTIPCRTDNYAYLLHDAAGGDTVLIDAPEAAPIAAALSARGWRLTDILITHHHGDHVEGIAALRAGARVIGRTGKPFTTANIGMALAMRELQQHLRETGESKGFNAAFTRADRSRFLQAMEDAVQAIIRG